MLPGRKVSGKTSLSWNKTSKTGSGSKTEGAKSTECNEGEMF